MAREEALEELGVGAGRLVMVLVGVLAGHFFTVKEGPSWGLLVTEAAGMGRKYVRWHETKQGVQASSMLFSTISSQSAAQVACDVRIEGLGMLHCYQTPHWFLASGLEDLADLKFISSRRNFV